MTGAFDGDCASIKSVSVDLAGASSDCELGGAASATPGCAVSEDGKSPRGNAPDASVLPVGRASASAGRTTGEMGVTVWGRDCRSVSLSSVVEATRDT
jgi:hypothetical protein